MHRPIRLLASSLLLVALAACGGDDDPTGPQPGDLALSPGFVDVDEGRQASFTLRNASDDLIEGVRLAHSAPETPDGQTFPFVTVTLDPADAGDLSPGETVPVSVSFEIQPEMPRPETFRMTINAFQTSRRDLILATATIEFFVP